MNSKKSERNYSWSLIIYDKKELIYSGIINNLDKISHYALSPYHNNDFDNDGKLKEPHYHLLITFKKFISLESIKRLFDLEQNLFGERLGNRYLAFKYLYHDNELDKTLYDENEIWTDDKSYYLERNIKDKKIDDNINYVSLIDDIINQVSYREMIILYGRDYILNYEKYLTMARLVARQEHLNKDYDLVQDMLAIKNDW